MLKSTLKNGIYSTLILTLITTQTYALDQNIEQQVDRVQLGSALSDQIQVQFLDDSQSDFNNVLNKSVMPEPIPHTRWTTKLWNQGLPRAKRQFERKLKKMSSAERSAYYSLFGAKNDQELQNNFEAQLIKEIPQMQDDLNTLGVRGYKRKIKAQLEELKNRVQNGESLESSLTTKKIGPQDRADRKIASVSAVLALSVISLLAILTILIALQIVAVFLLPIVIVAGIVVLITQSSYGGGNRCSPRGGCSATRRMSGYGR
jgi:hypothetical protein